MIENATDFLAHFGRVMNAQDRAAVGLYCECYEPSPVGTICEECERCLRDVEVEQVLRIVRAHDFTPDDRHEAMCAQCSNWADHPRHRGQDGIGRLRDGTRVDPQLHPPADEVDL